MKQNNRLSPRPSIKSIIELACGRRVDGEQKAAQTWQLVIASAVGALVLAAFWGLLAGSDSMAHAARNTFAVPLILLLSAMCALPAGLVALKLSGVAYRSRDLILSFASALFGSTLVMAVLAPIVAIYYHTSSAVGSYLALVSVGVAVLVGALLLMRGALRRAPTGTSRAIIALPSAILLVLQLAAMLQFIALASPILPDGSVFDGGFDGLLQR